MTGTAAAVVTLPAAVLLATHLLAAVAGGAVSYGIVVHWTEHDLPLEDTHMPNRKLRRGAWLGIVLLIASGMVVSIGVMAALQQRASDRDDRARADELRGYSECISRWGADLVQTINTRNADRAAYDAANQERSDALAEVVRVIILLRFDPPKADDQQLGAALTAAADADERVKSAGARLTDTRPTYKTPTLTCGRTP